MAEIYAQGGTEHVIINAVREVHFRRFQATDWKDLRVGFFLSLTDLVDDEDPSDAGIPEVIPATSTVPWTDRVQIGIVDSATVKVFCGYANLPANARTLNTVGPSELLASDIGIGTTNSFFWRFKYQSPPGPPGGDQVQVHMIDGGNNGLSISSAGDGSQMHFARVPASSGGYCTLFMLRFTRPDAGNRSRIITMQVKKTVGGHSSDVLFTNTPTLAVLEDQLEGFPTDVATLGPVELSSVPDAFWFYWPFSDSRLKIHAVGILKAS